MAGTVVHVFTECDALGKRQQCCQKGMYLYSPNVYVGRVRSPRMGILRAFWGVGNTRVHTTQPERIAQG